MTYCAGIEGEKVRYKIADSISTTYFRPHGKMCSDVEHRKDVGACPTIAI